jgi:plastocyanin
MRGITARAVRLVVASAIGGALLAPVAPMAADGPPRAALSVTPARPVAGEPVRLDASASSGAATYSWDLDGDGAFESSTGSRPALERTFGPGAHRVAVQVEDARGESDAATADVTVAAAQAPKPTPTPKPKPTPTAKPKPKPTAKPNPAPRFDAKPRVRESSRTAQPAQKPAVHAAASSSVTIKDFAFSPSTTTVSVGDTVSWTNQDSTPHTATGDGGSFDTGTLKKGQSGSHTFQSAGSFSYICSIHPNMKGTVVVTGASSGGGGSSSGSGGGGTGGSGSGSGDSTPTASGAGSSSGSLPHTGLELLAVALTGALMTAAGAALRLLVSAAPARRRARG